MDRRLWEPLRHNPETDMRKHPVNVLLIGDMGYPAFSGRMHRVQRDDVGAPIVSIVIAK